MWDLGGQRKSFGRTVEREVDTTKRPKNAKQHIYTDNVAQT